jgi:hypothetical protein
LVWSVAASSSWGIGLSTFKPTVAGARGLTIGNLIWGAIATWISLFCGGYVAALVGRSDDARDGILHGLVVWGVTAAVTMLFVLMLVSGLLNALAAIATAGSGDLRTVDLSGVKSVARSAATAIWFAWAGLLGGLFASGVGGWLGSFQERGIPLGRRERAAAATTAPGLRPQPT